MATLSDVASAVETMIQRSDQTANIKTAVKDAIRHYSRRNSWVIERRGAEIDLVASQTWYSTIDNTAGVGIESSPVGTAPTAADSLIGLLDIDYAKLEIGAIDWPLSIYSYRTFETLLENNSVSGTPRYITRRTGQIGFWPTPDRAFTCYLSGTFKPTVPSADADESVWFDQYQELIENSAARRMAFRWLQDTEMGGVFALAEKEQEDLLIAEGRTRRATGRITPTVI